MKYDTNPKQGTFFSEEMLLKIAIHLHQVSSPNGPWCLIKSDESPLNQVIGKSYLHLMNFGRCDANKYSDAKKMNKNTKQNLGSQD